MNIEKNLEEKEIIPFFQPIVSLENGDIFGYEVFSRIKEKSVAEFFELADKNEKIWKLEKFCRKTILKTVSYLGLKTNIFININPEIIFDEDFYQGYTLKLLKKYNIDSRKIILEITEKCSQEKKILNEITEHYRIQNFNIALDNVGAAYSGLERICSMNPNFIKIDMKIIRGIESDTLKQSMVKSLVQFCNETGISSVAVGVETAQELDFLLSVGVQFAQGFFIGIPNKLPEKVSAESYARIIAYKKNLKELTKNKNKDEEKIQTSKKPDLNKEKGIKSFLEDFRNAEEAVENGNSSRIGELAAQGITVFPDMNVLDLMNFFNSNKECTFVTVIDLNQQVLGVMTHSVLADLLGGRFGFGLNYRKTVKEVMITDFFVVNSAEPVEKVATKAMLRDEKNLYNPIIVTKKGIYVGVVTIKQLLDTIVSVEVQEKTREITKKNRLLQRQQMIQERDMKMAELVQKSFYPSKAPCKNGWETSFIFKPMASVSGDLYDFYFDKDKKFCGLGLFDVSGHGVASGLVGILSKYLAEKIFTKNQNKPLEKVIQEFSETLAQEKGSVENYLTGIFLRLNQNQVEYVNGGHTDVLLKSAKTGKVEILGGKDGNFRGMFLGMPGLPSDCCSTVKNQLEAGDILVLYTDCLIESRNGCGEEFGIERLQKILQEANSKTPKETLSYIAEKFKTYTKGVPLRDDLTIIVLQYTGIFD